MRIKDLYVLAPDWWLPLGEVAFREQFKNTNGMNAVECFRREPTSDADYYANFFPNELFRRLSAVEGLTEGDVSRVALQYQLEAGNMELKTFEDKTKATYD